MTNKQFDLKSVLKPICSHIVLEFHKKLNDEEKNIPNNGLKTFKDVEDYFYKILHKNLKFVKKTTYKEDERINLFIHYSEDILYYICMSLVNINKNNRFIGIKPEIRYENNNAKIYEFESMNMFLTRVLKEKLSTYYIYLIKKGIKEKIDYPENQLTFKQVKITLFVILRSLFPKLYELTDYIIFHFAIDFNFIVNRELNKYSHHDFNEICKAIILKEKIEYFLQIERLFEENIYIMDPVKFWKPEDFMKHFDIYVDSSLIYDTVPKDGLYMYELIASHCIVPHIKADTSIGMFLILRDNLIWLYGPNDFIENIENITTLTDEEKEKRLDNIDYRCLYDYIDSTSYSEMTYILRGGLKSWKAANLFITSSDRIQYLFDLCQYEVLLNNLQNSWLLYSYPTDQPYVLYKAEHKLLNDNEYLYRVKMISPPKWLVYYYNKELPEILMENKEKKPYEILEIIKRKYNKCEKYELYFLCLIDSLLEKYCQKHIEYYKNIFQKIKGENTQERIEKLIKLIIIKTNYILYMNHPLYDWCRDNLLQ